MSEKLHVWLRPASDFDNAFNNDFANEADSFLGPQLCYDVEVIDKTATLGDYLGTLEAFQATTLADCKGCDGCCQERAPLTVYDPSLAGVAEEELAVWLTDWAEPAFFGEALDIRLRRLTAGENAGCCQFLDTDRQFCRIHERRSFTCRTHCCLPKSPRAEALRGALINAGEDELVRRLLSLPPTLRPWGDMLANCRLEDYPRTVLSDKSFDAWPEVRLQELLPSELWQELCRK